MGRPIVYGPTLSFYVWSTRLALAEKGVAHDRVDVGPLAAFSEEPHLSRHPFAKVPAFEHDDFMLYETQAIMRYVDEAFPSAPLQPTDLHQWSRMNQVMGIVDAYAQPSIGSIVYQRTIAPLLGHATDEAAIAASLPRSRICITEFARLLGDQEFMAGDRVSLADLMLAPLLYNFRRVPEGETMLAEQPGLLAWLKRIEGRQSFQVTRP